jgi:hypothetical protein
MITFSLLWYGGLYAAWLHGSEKIPQVHNSLFWLLMFFLNPFACLVFSVALIRARQKLHEKLCLFDWLAFVLVSGPILYLSLFVVSNVYQFWAATGR